MPSRPYKDFVIYGCFVLNRLVAGLDIDLNQGGLEEKLDAILAERRASLSKEEVKREIRSNHVMTNKVIEALVKDGLVGVAQEEGRYRISITKAGVLHIRKYNEFYKRIYKEQIRDHYKYTGLPYWFR
jgi:predicted transcriptional regulator